MSWKVKVHGAKAEAATDAAAQCDENIAKGYQTEAQKLLVMAALDALAGTHVSVNAGGHNNEHDGTMSIEVQGNTP